MVSMKKHFRNCPNCKIRLYYSSKYTAKYCEKNNRLCSSCSQTGKKLSKKHRKKIGIALLGNQNSKGYKHTKEQCKKRSINCNWRKNKGKIYEEMYGIKKAKDKRNKISKNNSKYWLGKHHSNKSKRRMRLSKIKWIEENKNNGLQISPGFNKNACQIIDDYGKKNGYNFQHAMNGGEFYIKDLGYWVDGVDHKNKIICEYYEKHHKRQIKKDKQRIKEIKEFLPNYKIIILREWKNEIEIL